MRKFATDRFSETQHEYFMSYIKFAVYLSFDYFFTIIVTVRFLQYWCNKQMSLLYDAFDWFLYVTFYFLYVHYKLFS